MSVTGDMPVGASGLAAALGVEASVGGTGGKPVSVDNLAAALGSRRLAVLYDGPVASTVTLSSPMGGFSMLYMTLSNASGGVEAVGAHTYGELTSPDAASSGLAFGGRTKAQGYQIPLEVGGGGATVSSKKYPDWRVARVIGYR